MDESPELQQVQAVKLRIAEPLPRQWRIEQQSRCLCRASDGRSLCDRPGVFTLAQPDPTMAGMKGGQGSGVDHSNRLGDREQKGNRKKAQLSLRGGQIRWAVRKRRAGQSRVRHVYPSVANAGGCAPSPASRTAGHSPGHRENEPRCGRVRTIAPSRKRSALQTRSGTGFVRVGCSHESARLLRSDRRWSPPGCRARL